MNQIIEWMYQNGARNIDFC